MKKTIQELIEKLQQNVDGTMNGGFASIRGGTNSVTTCNNTGICSGDNTTSCKNSGDCSGGTNSATGEHGTCSNTGSCYIT